MAWKFFTKDGAEKRIPATVTTPAVFAYHNVAQSIAAGGVPVNFNSEKYSTDSGMHNTVTNNDRFVCTVAGKYLFEASIEIAANATGTRQVYFRKNGASDFYGSVITQNLGAGATVGIVASAVIDMAVGDYVQVYCNQASGGALNIDSAAGGVYNACSCQMTKIDGSVVSYVGVPGSLVGQELAYAEWTSDVSTSQTVVASATTIVTSPSFTVDGSTPVMVEVFCPNIATPAIASSYVVGDLWLDSTDLGWLVQSVNNSTASTMENTFRAARRLTPAAGTHTVSLRGWVGGGTAVFRAGTGVSGATRMPGFIRVTRAA